MSGQLKAKRFLPRLASRPRLLAPHLTTHSALSTSLSTIYRKVIKIENDGIITRHTTLLDLGKIGYPFKIGAFISANKREEMEKYLKQHQNSNTLIKLSGGCEFYAELVFKDVGDYGEFEHAMRNSEMVRKQSRHFITDAKR
ncbi:MAG: Lrp/AsnC family transcriptional regulator [Deltaproteobacteria bacterium]|nr:MAG: Lrp/AsnC family transcriptional regulator [Deltaproteobacteria bacterium]